VKKSRYRDSQILAILKQAEGGVPVPDLCRAHCVSSAAFEVWWYARLADEAHEGTRGREPALVKDVYRRAADIGSA